MQFSVQSALHYQVQSETTFLFSLSCLQNKGQRILEETLTCDAAEDLVEVRVGAQHNRFHRLRVADPCELSIQYEAVVETRPKFVDLAELREVPVEGLGSKQLPYLFPSRYAQTDLLRGAAWDLFGHHDDPVALAMAVEDWLHEHIIYQFGASTEQCSALETFAKRVGVCRDFAHLGIAFCRALNLPARYVTAYAYGLEPQDFHAVFEVFIGGRWFVIDGTRKVPLNGLVRIATGRDASDVAMATMFGQVVGTGVSVDIRADDIGKPFVPLTRDLLLESGKAVRLR